MQTIWKIGRGVAGVIISLFFLLKAEDYLNQRDSLANIYGMFLMLLFSIGAVVTAYYCGRDFLSWIGAKDEKK